MSIVLWILQFVLAIAFVLTGLVKVLQPYEVLADRMAWVQDYSPGLVRGIGALEILGGIGLVLPATYLIALPILTPLAAAGLAVIMALAVLHHLRSHERGQVLFTAALLILLIIVAWGRFSLAPL